jgi:RHS repeat-associated protein
VYRFDYDPQGNVTGLTDFHQVRTGFSYDLDNFLIRKTWADGRFETSQYDAAGYLVRETNARGISANYTWDVNGNLLQITYSDQTPSVAFTYDAHDRLTKVVDGSGTTEFTYDIASRIVSTKGPWTNDTITYTYDDLGRVTTMTPQGGETVTTAYDGMGRISTISVGGQTFVYNYTSPTSSLVQTLTRSSGGTATSYTYYTYDALKRLTGVNNSTGPQTSYTYNAQDQRDTETITGGLPAPVATTGMKTGTFNPLNQLLSQTSPNRDFIYDADGNMTRGYTKDGYLFDATYDGENRLQSLSYTDGNGILHKTVYTYRYDSFLAKIVSYENNVLVSETRIVRSGNLELQDRDGSNAVIREYAWGLHLGGGIGGLLNIREGNNDYHPLYDGKGNIVALSGITGTLVAQYRYSPFGRLEAKTGNIEQPFGFSTKRTDPQTGLVYYGYRFYHPDMERWLNRDPIGEDGGINLYGFVENNPVNWIDPWGLARTTVDCAIKQAASRGDVAELEGLLKMLDLTSKQRILIQNNIDRLKTKGGDLLAKEIKGSVKSEFPGEMKNKTLAEIIKMANEGNKRAQIAKKLLQSNKYKK